MDLLLLLVVITLVVVPLVRLFSFVGCQVVFPLDEPQEVTLVIDAGCDTGVTSIMVQLDGDMEVGQHFQTTVSPVPPGGLVISTVDFNLKPEDEGKVQCLLGIVLNQGEPLTRTAMHDKLEDEAVAPFKLWCQDGGFLLT
jgi:hypothetical protein